MRTHFIVHDSNDSVGVVVVTGVLTGEQVNGWVMDTDETITCTALEEVPLGHKLALRTIPQGGTVTKYGQDIGIAVADISPGAHVHVHNVKTKRW